MKFTSGGTVLAPQGTVAASATPPRLKYDVNGDLFLKKSDTKIDRIAPATAAADYTYTKSPAGSFYVTDSTEKVVLVDSPDGLTSAKTDTSDPDLALDSGTPILETISFTVAPVTQDTFIDGASPTKNFNGTDEIRLKGSAIWGVVQFDLSGVTSGLTVTSAQLRLNIRDTADASKGGADISVHRITAPWTETGVTWDNTSANHVATPEVTFHIDSSMDDQYVTADIATLVQAWVDGTYPNYGIVLRSSGIERTRFNPKEKDASLAPSIAITAATSTTVVRLAQPTTTTTSSYNTADGEPVNYTTTNTEDSSLLFVGAVNTADAGLSTAPNLERGKSKMADKRIDLRAAVYGPEGFDQWFLPSATAVRNYTLFSNNGHGNNADGVDVSNPGQGGGGPNGEVDPSGGVDDEIK